jgi:hypothetical protein
MVVSPFDLAQDKLPWWGGEALESANATVENVQNPSTALK